MRDTYHEHLRAYVNRHTPSASTTGSASSASTGSASSGRSSSTTHHYHHHYNSWGSSWGWGSPWWWSPPQTHIHHNYYGSHSSNGARGTNYSSGHGSDRDRDREKKDHVTGDTILAGLAIGGLAAGTFYYFSGRYLDYCDERNLLEGLENRRERMIFRHYDATHRFLTKNLQYSWDMFTHQLALCGTFFGLISNWIWWDNVGLMYFSLGFGTLIVIDMIWNYQLRERRKDLIQIDAINGAIADLQQQNDSSSPSSSEDTETPSFEPHPPNDDDADWQQVPSSKDD